MSKVAVLIPCYNESKTVEKVVTACDSREFFTGNSFYTTAANRMARHIFPDAVTVKDVIESCRRNRRQE